MKDYVNGDDYVYYCYIINWVLSFCRFGLMLLGFIIRIGVWSFTWFGRFVQYV